MYSGAKPKTHGIPEVLYTPRGILVQRISERMYASLVMPCRHHYGAGEQGVFTCLHSDPHHAHLVINEDGMGIYPACIESKEMLIDVLNTLVERGDIDRAEKAQFIQNDANRLSLERLTPHELDVRRSPDEYRRTTTAIHIVLDPPE